MNKKQKSQISKKKAEAKIAEKKILAEDEMKKAGGDMQILQEIKRNLKNEIRRIEEDMEAKKKAVRHP